MPRGEIEFSRRRFSENNIMFYVHDTRAVHTPLSHPPILLESLNRNFSHFPSAPANKSAGKSIGTDSNVLSSAVPCLLSLPFCPLNGSAEFSRDKNPRLDFSRWRSTPKKNKIKETLNNLSISFTRGKIIRIFETEIDFL